MSRLTEEMVIARSKQSDLSAVKKLNCWGAELKDVSLLRRMPNVEILVLSINQITTLADFSHCPYLKELYIRKNAIQDLSEVRHLIGLQFLQNLWLGENPCSEAPNYRMSVLRALPHLEKLDNIQVQPEEVQEALRKGTPIIDPDDEYYNQQDQESYVQYREPRSAESSPDRNNDYRRLQDQTSECSESNVEFCERVTVAPSNGCSRSPPPKQRTSGQTSPPTQQRYSPDPEYHRNRYDRPLSTNVNNTADELTSPKSLRHTNSIEEPSTNQEKPTIRHSQSAQSVKDYPATNGDAAQSRYGSGYRTSPPFSRHSADMTQPYYERRNHQEVTNKEGGAKTSEILRFFRKNASRLGASGRNGSYASGVHQLGRCPQESSETSSRRGGEGGDIIASAVMGERRGFTRRPVTRNSNLLSAVLCLVKELDYPSLEVVEMAVRCRMDELANSQ